MVIRSITVESFGTLSGPITIELDERLNVICGPNEAGKSTLMRAVWFAFTRKAGSQAAEIKAINPRSGGSPYVKIEFTRDGTTYTLEKEFTPPNGMTKLLVESPDGQISEFTADDADDEVGRVLGFGKPTGRTKTPAHYGMWPATWMDQHERSVDPGMRLAADGDKEGLSELLARATGHVLAGAEGEGLVEKAKAEYDRYFTNSGSETKKSGAPLHEARKALEEAEEAQKELLNRQGSYEDALQRYASLKEELEKLEEELPKLREREKEAKERKQKADELTGKLATQEERLKTQAGCIEKLESERVLTRIPVPRGPLQSFVGCRRRGYYAPIGIGERRNHSPDRL